MPTPSAPAHLRTRSDAFTHGREIHWRAAPRAVSLFTAHVWTDHRHAGNARNITTVEAWPGWPRAHLASSARTVIVVQPVVTSFHEASPILANRSAVLFSVCLRAVGVGGVSRMTHPPPAIESNASPEGRERSCPPARRRVRRYAKFGCSSAGRGCADHRPVLPTAESRSSPDRAAAASWPAADYTTAAGRRDTHRVRRWKGVYGPNPAQTCALDVMG